MARAHFPNEAYHVDSSAAFGIIGSGIDQQTAQALIMFCSRIRICEETGCSLLADLDACNWAARPTELSEPAGTEKLALLQPQHSEDEACRGIQQHETGPCRVKVTSLSNKQQYTSAHE